MKPYKFITITILLFVKTAAFSQADFALAEKPIEQAIAKISPVILKKDSVSSLPAKDTAQLTNGKVIYGIASFYSKSLEGTKTSTGERFHHKLMTAASNNFPLNTWVRVTNLRNGKSVIVRINDHMAPKMAKRGRVVDLSHSAAKELDFILLGIVRVKVEEVPAGTDE